MNTWGKAGEAAALAYLREKGYRWITSNFSTRWGEVDLIVENEAALIFVEVKKRNSLRYGRPEDAITPWKMKRMEKAALEFMRFLDRPKKMVRFDVIAIDAEGLRHYQNAFMASPGFY